LVATVRQLDLMRARDLGVTIHLTFY